MSLRHALLGALADQPRTGYALLKHFEQSLGQAWPASHSQIYPELARLRSDGLIRETATGPRAIADVRAHRGRPGRGPPLAARDEPDRRVRSDAALRVFFLWLLEPAEAEAFLERERAHVQRPAGAVRADSAEDPVLRTRKQRAFRLALEGGIRSLEARLAWIDWAAGEVGSRSWAELDAPATVP